MGALQDAVDQVAAQLAKAQAEIQSKIADLEIQIGLGETVDLSALKAAAQALDDVVPDSIEEPTGPDAVPADPEPEAPVDPEAPA